MKIKRKENRKKKLKIALKKLLEARVHLGHLKGRWNPKTKPYIHGIRDNFHIIDLKESARLLSRSLFLIKDLLKVKGKILVFGNAYENAAFVQGISLRFSRKLTFINKKWIGGSLTNRKILRNSPQSNLPYSYTKSKLIIVLNPNEYILSEASRLNVPVVGIVDSTTDPKFYSYPIPGNDDSVPSHFFYCQALAYLLQKSSYKKR